jgi:dihydrofolate reductase
MVDVVIIGGGSFNRHFCEVLDRQLVGNINKVNDDDKGKHEGDEVFDMMWNF